MREGTIYITNRGARKSWTSYVDHFVQFLSTERSEIDQADMAAIAFRRTTHMPIIHA
jgi:hypothetical protein